MGEPERRGPAADAAWGRVAGASPPLPAWAPLVAWAVTATVLTVVVLAVVGGPGPLDDPDPGDQRPGFLVDADDARSVRTLGLPGQPVGRRPVLLVFDRNLPSRRDLKRAVADVPAAFAIVLVRPAAHGEAADTAGSSVVIDRQRRIADVVGLPTPKDGGPPIGYAVIDGRARVRYATLDPSYAEHGFEIEIVTEAVR